MRERKIFISTLILFVFLITIGFNSLAFNEQINYQGKLMDKQGGPVSDGGKCLKFRLMDAETGGNEIWSEEWTTSTEMVTTTKGLFSVMLGKYNSLSNVNFNQVLYLEVQFDPGCDGTYEEIFLPRKPIGASVAAFEAKKLLGYDWASPGIIGATNPNEANFTKLTVSATSTLSTTTISGLFTINNNLFYVDPINSRVGIATSTPNYKLDVAGNLRTTDYLRSDTGLCIGDSCITSWGSAVNYWTLNDSYLSPNNLSWNVGIGTSTPAEKLTVEGNILATGNLTVQGLTFLSTTTISTQLTVPTITSPSSLTISPSANATTTITGPVILASQTGNVGIGTTTPAYKLDVSGDLRVSGQTIFGGVAYTWPSSAGSQNQFLNTDGAGNLAWVSADNYFLTNPTIIKYKTYDESVYNSATLQDDDEFFFDIGANENWVFRFVLHGNSGATPDFQFAVSAPSGASCKIAVIDAEGAVTVANLSCEASSGLIAGNGAEDLYEVVGTINNGSTPGQVRLRWAQYAANASYTYIRQGSYLQAFRSLPNGIAKPFIHNGNSFGELAKIGTNDNFGLAFLTNGIERMRLDSSGYLGIGTTSPAYLLDVAGNIRSIGDVIGSRLCIGSDCKDTWPSGGGGSYWTLAGNYLYTSSTDWSVGIGTTTASAKLTVQGDILAAGNLTIQGTSNLGTTTISGPFSVNESGIITSGVWQATAIGTLYGGTGLSSLGGINQILGVNNERSALEYKNIASLLSAGSGISISGTSTATIVNEGILSLNSGEGILISLGQNPTITNLGVLSINSATGTLTLQGTTNQINVSTNSGVITLSLPQDIATTSSPTFSGLTLSSLNSGSVLFGNGSGLISQDNANFYWDNTNKKLGIGTSSPAYKLDIAGPLRLIPNSQPTGANGVIYYDSTLDKFRCYQGGAWTDCIGYSPMRDMIVVEEFVSGLTTSGYIGELGWLMAAGTVAGQAPSEGKIGILRLSSPATANSRGVLQLSPGTAGVMIIPGQTGDIHIKMEVRNAQAAATDSTRRIGFLNTNAAGEASDAIMFRASGTGNWTAVTRAGGTETATDCGVAQATTFKTFEILINPAFNQVTFIIDGVTCATHTTNITTAALSPTFKVDTTAATAYGIDIDRFVMVRSPLIGGSDLAEYYYTKDDSIEPGDVVSVDGMILAGVKKSEKPYDEKVLGVISTEPGMILGGALGKGRAVLVALSGRVPVKVSNENGEIKPGDLLTSSNIPGVAMKATEPGRVIGMALESSEKCEREELERGECKILMFVNPHWSLGSIAENGNFTTNDSTTNDQQRTILDQFTLAIKRALEKLGLLIENGVAKVEKIFAKEIVVEKMKSEEVETKKIKMEDKATGEIYCLWIENGEIKKGKGDCEENSQFPIPNSKNEENEEELKTQNSNVKTEGNEEGLKNEEVLINENQNLEETTTVATTTQEEIKSQMAKVKKEEELTNEIQNTEPIIEQPNNQNVKENQ